MARVTISVNYGLDSNVTIEEATIFDTPRDAADLVSHVAELVVGALRYAAGDKPEVERPE